MKSLRLLLPSLAMLVLVATGCFITSGQVLVFYELPNPFTFSAGDGFERIDVDLNTISEYDDHKDKLKDLTDFAVLGTFTNTSGPAGTLAVYITADATSYTTYQQLLDNAVLLWGPASIGASGSSEAVVQISWDESAGLFTEIGKNVLIAETKGDGQFTIYTVGSQGGTYSIRVDGGGIALTLDAGI
jgi:hypothetical protein